MCSSYQYIWCPSHRPHWLFGSSQAYLALSCHPDSVSIILSAQEPLLAPLCLENIKVQVKYHLFCFSSPGLLPHINHCCFLWEFTAVSPCVWVCFSGQTVNSIRTPVVFYFSDLSVNTQKMLSTLIDGLKLCFNFLLYTCRNGLCHNTSSSHAL